MFHHLPLQLQRNCKEEVRARRRRAGGAGGPGYPREHWLQLGAAQGTFYGQTGQGDHCSKPARVVHLVGQEPPPANSGLEEAGMRGSTRTALQGAACRSTPSTVPMEAGDVSSGNAVSDPAQAKHGPILSPLGAEPGPGSPPAGCRQSWLSIRTSASSPALSPP